MDHLLDRLRHTDEWGAMEAALETERERRLRLLLRGCTHDEYLTLCGEIRGIELVLQTPIPKHVRKAETGLPRSV